jgi:hypothetical protein
MITALNSPDAKIALLRQALSANPQSQLLSLRLAEALIDKGDTQAAAELFRRAYLLKPFIWNGRPGANPQTQRDDAFAMIKHGAIFSSTISALAVGEARLGHKEEVQKLVNYDLLFRDFIMDPPSGYGRADFNRAFAAEIKSDLTFYGEPAKRAIRNAWRHDSVMRSNQPACTAFTASIQREVLRYIADLPRWTGHPFLDSRPADFVLRGWAVVSDGKSHHKSHIHPFAWASGVYYVLEPPTSKEQCSDRGWLHIGPPENLGVFAEHGWAQRLIAPKAGRLVIMPGYFYHHTRPMGVDEERICVAFDVVPQELAIASPDTADYYS